MVDAASYPLTTTHAAELATCRRANAIDEGMQGIAVDSRKLRRGDLFVALAGERTDGHRFLADAVSRGAAGVLVNEAFLRGEEGRAFLASAEVPVLAAEESLAALQRMAAARLRSFPGLTRVAVTGSNGKTTTKELVAAVLSRLGSTVKNSGNLNSEIGLAQALMEIRSHHEYGVFELGINHPGEMDLLTEVYPPQYTVITSIGTAHIGLLGSREAIAEEKGKAIAALPSSGRGFIPEDCIWKDYLASISSAALVPFGIESTEGLESVEDLGFDGWRLRYEGREILLSLMGRHNLSNALAAVTVGRFLGASPEQIAGGLEDLSLPAGRSRSLRGRVNIFEDSYNANLDSMRAVIGEMSRRVEGDELVLVLGAMKELGEETEPAHRELAEICLESAAKGIFLLGEEMRSTVEVLNRGGYTGHLRYSESFEELEEELLAFLRGGDTLLLKGSRVMELERLVEPLLSKKYDDGTNTKE